MISSLKWQNDADFSYLFERAYSQKTKSQILAGKFGPAGLDQI